MQERMKSGLLARADGATAIEYAVVLPMLLLTLMGIVEYDIIMYGMSVIDGAITSAAREGSTGYVNETGTGSCPSPVVNGSVSPQSQAQFINCFVALHTAGLFNAASLQVSYNDTGSSSFNSTNDAPAFPTGPCTNNPALVNMPSFPLCSENSQSAGDIVVYTVTYPWPVYSPVLQPFLGSSYTLSASAVVKNEPYNVGAR